MVSKNQIHPQTNKHIMKDLNKIQEFFSKPLEEGKQLDTTDFNKVVKAVEQTGHPVTVLFVPKFNEIEVLTGMDAPDDMIRDLSNAVDSLGYSRNDIIIAGDSSNLSRREYSDIFRVNGGHQDYFEESVNEMDMNDPVLMRMRAAKNAKPDFGKEYGDAVKTAYGNDKNAKKLAFLKKERAQLMRDMEQEAEPEGGPIANEYGSKLNRIDAAIAKLEGRKEMTYDQAIAEGFKDYLGYSSVEVSRPTQDQVDRFFALTQNETHYLNSKPVEGQEKTFNKMKVEPWDEYDLSNWNALVKKAKAKGKSLDEVKVDYDFSERELIRVLRQLKRGASTEIDMIKAFTKSLGRDITKDELFSESLDEGNSYARVSMPRFKKDKNNPNFLNVYINYDLGAGGSSIALGKETMTGQIRRESAAEAMRLAGDVARDLEAEYNLEDIDIQDLENGKVRIFAVSDDFINMDPNMLGEIKESLNPEVSRDVNRYIARTAKRYDYSEQDAVYAIMAALKQRDFDGLNEDTRKDLGMSSSVSKRRAKAELKNPGNDGSKVYGLDKDGKRVHIKNINDVDKFTKFELDADLNESVVEKVIAQLKEEKPGLWANIRAKKARGEKPAHGNSDAFKSAKKAGKKINSLDEEEGVPHFTKDGKEWKGKVHKMPDDSLMSGNPHDKNGSGPNGKSEKLFHKEDLNEVEDNGSEEKSFDAELMAAANSIAVTLGKELKAKQGDKEQLDEAIVTSAIAAVLTGNALIGFISKISKKLAKKLNWKEGEDFAGKINKWAHDNEVAFQSPIKRILKFFIKDETKLEATTKGIYAIIIISMAASYGADAISSLSKASWFKAAIASLKGIAKGDEAIATAYPVVKSFIA
jgi:hypothetical protein